MRRLSRKYSQWESYLLKLLATGLAVVCTILRFIDCNYIDKTDRKNISKTPLLFVLNTAIATNTVLRI